MGGRLGVRSATECIVAAVLCGLIGLSNLILDRTAQAEQAVAPKGSNVAPRPDLRAMTERMNANTLTLVTGNPSFIFTAYGNDLAAVLNDGDELRILPVTSQGAVQNVRDVRFLRGIDLGFTVSNILGYYRRTGELGDLEDKLVYIMKISNDEIHLVTRSYVTTLEQLRGRKVNFNSKGSGTQMTARDIFTGLNIDVEEVNLGPADAFAKLANGEIAATVLTSSKPAAAIAPLKASEGYRLLPVPYAKPLRDDYLPSTLTHEDYPDLIAAGENGGHDCSQQRAVRLQLAQEQRSLSAGRQIRQSAVREIHRIAEAAAQPQLARGQSRRHLAWLEALRRRRGAAGELSRADRGGNARAVR
jgi:TRAP transporter TAXI family solute receptor